MKARLEKGCWVFYPPMGFEYTKNKLYGKIITPKNPEAKILKQGMEKYAHGIIRTQEEFRRFLQLKLQRNFPKVAPKRILTQVLYAGYIEYQPWGINQRKGVHKGIIDINTFEKIQIIT